MTTLASLVGRKTGRVGRTRTSTCARGRWAADYDPMKSRMGPSVRELEPDGGGCAPACVSLVSHGHQRVEYARRGELEIYPEESTASSTTATAATDTTQGSLLVMSNKNVRNIAVEMSASGMPSARPPSAICSERFRNRRPPRVSARRPLRCELPARASVVSQRSSLRRTRPRLLAEYRVC